MIINSYLLKQFFSKIFICQTVNIKLIKKDFKLL